MPKILFIQPTQYGEKGGLCKQKKIYLPGLVFPLLAAITPPNWEYEMKIEVVDNIDFDTDADIVGIGTMGYTIFRGLELAAEFRKRGKLVVMGGYMSSLVPEKAAKFVDSVIVGDAEISYPKMLKDFETTGKIAQIYHNPIKSIEGLPLPKYELLTEKPIGTMLPVQAGRGCNYACTFCSIACLYKGRYMTRPVKEVIRDIKKIKELGFNEFYLIDDNLMSNPGYMMELCRQIEPLKMKWSTQCTLLLGKNKKLLAQAKKSGAVMMSFGVESITQESVDQFNKKWLKVDDHKKMIRAISEAGILVSTEMIVGGDYDTEKSLRDTFKFIEEANIPIPRFYIITPMPGTELYDQYKKEGRLLTEDYKLYSGSQAVFHPKKISAEKLTEMYWWLLKKTYSLKSIIKRTLLNPGARKDFFRYLFAFFVNLHYRKYAKKNVPPNIF